MQKELARIILAGILLYNAAYFFFTAIFDPEGEFVLRMLVSTVATGFLYIIIVLEDYISKSGGGG